MTREAVLGVLSLILWALIVVVTLKYVFILLRADNRGEGGTLALMALAQRALSRNTGAVVFCGIISAALFYGDAMITPALSVLSAIEGLKVATPAFDPYIVPVTAVILVALFAVQSKGTARVAAFFGPITVVWFVAIAIPGVIAVAGNPEVLLAFSPVYGDAFSGDPRGDRAHHPGRGFPRRHRRRSALCRPRPFRPKADPDGMGRARPPGAGAELSRTGRAAARRSEGDREPVLPALSRMGAAADGRAGDCRDGDREPGRHHRRLFDQPAGDPARPPAAPGNPPHLGSAVRPNLHAAGELRSCWSACCCSWPCSAPRVRLPRPTASP